MSQTHFTSAYRYCKSGIEICIKIATHLQFQVIEIQKVMIFAFHFSSLSILKLETIKNAVWNIISCQLHEEYTVIK